MTEKTTEQESRYAHLEKMSVTEILEGINKEDREVPIAIEKVIPEISKAVELITERMKAGGRLFYIGAGTSGRLGIVDASELPPTFGLEHGKVIGLIAGGDTAIRKAVEFAEDNLDQGWADLKQFNINKLDTVIGIAASGTTPYVIGAMQHCNANHILTIGITCNKEAPLSKSVNLAIEVVVGPEFLTGSTRMKAGTAQKLTLNMISTAVMIRMGRVRGNKMVDMQLTNNKLISRGTKMIMESLGVDAETANKLLLKYGSVRNAVDAVKQGE